MCKNCFSGSFAGVELNFVFRHEDTADFFGRYLKPALPVADPVRIPLSDCDCWMQEFGLPDSGSTEFGMSVYRTSDALLPLHRCLFHAAALVWHGKAWLFAADSGVGKSTQIRHWKELYGDQVQILNGDKPILSFDEDARIMVHPSPWKGKEVWGDDSLSAPLGGLILLKQGDHNAIKSISPIYCAARLLSYFFSSFEQAAYVQSLCAMEERMLQSVPVLELVNLGDADSARLTHDYLLKGGEAHGGFSEV